MREILLFIRKILYKYRRSRDYKIEGSCNQCGKCCQNIYCLDDYTTTDFKITQFIYPSYKRFEVHGKDQYGNIVLRCNWLTEGNKCKDYANRLPVCRNYPNTSYGLMGNLPEGCGFRVVPRKKFSDFIK